MTMKTLFIEARYKEKIVLSKEVIEKLPDKIGLITTVQYVDQSESIKKQLFSKEGYIQTTTDQMKTTQLRFLTALTPF